ncbi:PLP-dependent aminotransferase family protein [Candidatus Methylospira mobilis]|uniref:PLP-dependent aminotransferase family protein n=1 Tax=Candidatus Methylospira mobilis TaxID=1808979 RepID=A0A5Q0BKD2_9GAMM|nr:PLP-dependent aminotransferase family protein [Candidatus Methylospira mobilis]QFY44293.1 PLP-dependent aminotransferase family protein [Candidatus Methylospira mobilis]
MRQAEQLELSIATKPAQCSIKDWVYSEIRLAILSGRLKPRARLPTTRDFAKHYGVSRSMVVLGYEQLLAEGYIESHTGKGTFVSAKLPDNLDSAPAPQNRAAVSLKGRLSRMGKVLADSPFFYGAEEPAPVPFKPNQPDYGHFPLSIWNRIVSKRANALRPRSMGYADPAGYLPLRASIAEHLRYTQRIRCTAEQVVITNSAQQALDLCIRLLLDPGDTVWMEDPGYPGAKALFSAVGAQVIAVPVDANGMDIQAPIQMVAHAKLAYVTSAHQSPIGPALSLERRIALLEWAEQHQATILEDDYDGEFRFNSTPVAPIKSLDSTDRVIYMGTFSKLLFPSIRLAYVLLPEWLQKPFASAMSLTCRHVGLEAQTVLCEFIAEGHYARHLRRMKLIYQERAEAFTSACDEQLDGLLDVCPISTGLDACAFLPENFDDVEVSWRLKQCGIEARPLSFYGIERKPRNGLVLGFSAFTPEQIVSGVQQMSKILAEYQGSSSAFRNEAPTRNISTARPIIC